MRPKPDVTEDPPTTHARDSPNSSPTIALALALVQHLGLTSDEITFLLAASPLTPEEAQFAARVDPDAIARAYTPGVTAALAAPQCPIAITAAKPAELEARAARVRTAATITSKLEAATTRVELAARGDADVLDKVTREVVPQVRARAAVVSGTATQYASVLAYHRTRYPGPGKKAKKPAPTP